MIRGIDDLIYFLLERISVRSGATYDDLKKHVQEFYAEPEDVNSGAKLLNAATDLPPPAIVDDLLLNKVWQWLTEESEIRVEQAREEAPIDTGIVQSGSVPLRNGSQQPHSLNEDHSRYQQNLYQLQAEDRYRGLILRTTPERVWKAITGHDVDHSRVPKSEFELLCLIAACGEHGIIQPDLQHQSKQDKRSVPKRTDDLQRKGYIVKTSVRRVGGTTSHCVLRKFAKILPSPSNDEGWVQMAPDQIRSVLYSDNGLQKAKFLAPAMAIIKKAGTIALSDFRERMGIVGARSARQAVDLWLFHLELVGCIQRLLRKGSKRMQVHSLRYIKDVDHAAQGAFSKFHKKDREALWMEKYADLECNNEEELLTTERRNEDEPLTTELSGKDRSLAESIADPLVNSSKEADSSNSPLKWHPQRPLENQIHDIIKASGPNGITTPDLVASLAGAAAYRSLDMVLARLTDTWQVSQPFHLRHLTIIRDTSVRNGSLLFLYRTLPNFDVAVQRGEASWEAVTESNGSLGSNNPTQESNASILDDWGFPKLSDVETDVGLDQAGTPKVNRGKRKGREENVDVPDRKTRIPTSSRSRMSTQSIQPRTPVLVLTKLHEHFKERMQKKAQTIVGDQNSRNGPGGIAIRSGLRQRQTQLAATPHNASPSSRGEGTGKTVASLQHKDKSSHSLAPPSKEKIEEVYESLLRMSLPGLYINPPQRYPRSIGRPLKKLLIIIKSDRLRRFDWFRNSSAPERYWHDPHKTFEPVHVIEERWRNAVKRAVNAGAKDNIIPRETSRLSNTNATSHSLNHTYNTTSQSSMPGPLTVEDQSSKNAEGSVTPQAHSGNMSDSFVTSISDYHNINGSQMSSKSRVPSAFKAVSGKKQTGVRLSGGSQDRLRVDIIMNILVQAGGVYPGPRDLWYPYVTSQRKTGPTAKVDPGTVERAVMSLVKSGKLKRLMFAFKALGGGRINRSVVFLPQLDANSEIVKSVKDKMIEHHPANYLPDGVEIDRTLRMAHKDRLGINYELPRIIVEHEFEPQIEKGLPKKRRRLERDEDSASASENEVDDDEASEEQLELQSEFYIEGYIHDPEAVPQGRNTIGRRLSKTLKFDDTQDTGTLKPKIRKSKEFEATPRHAPTIPVDPFLLRDGQSSSGARHQTHSRISTGQRNSRSPPKPSTRWVFTAVPETAAAAQQEALREWEALQNATNGASVHENDTFVKVNPNSWIISSTKLPWPQNGTRYALSTTFTNPDQVLNPWNGTFSTEYAVIRDVRPKLALKPSLQRDFENQLPNSLSDIVGSSPDLLNGNQESGRDASFYSVIDAVEAWEKQNATMLSSANSLMTPRFVNHTFNDQQLTHVLKSQPGTTEGLGRKRGANTDLKGETVNKWRRLESKSTDVQTQAGQPEPVDTLPVDMSMARTTGELLAFDKPPEIGRYGKATRDSSHTAKRVHKRRRGALEPEDEPQDVLPPDASEAAQKSKFSAKLRRPGRKSVQDSQISEEQLERLICIVAVVRCLLGGSDRVIKWPIVEQLFTDFNSSAIKYRWKKFSPSRKEYIDAFERAFHAKFIPAFEAGEVEAPQYDMIDKFDWKSVVTWAQEHVSVDKSSYPAHLDYTISRKQREVQHAALFEDRPRFEREFVVQETNDPLDGSINDVLSGVVSVNKRKQTLGNLPFCSPFAETSVISRPAYNEEDEVINSYIRATILTPEQLFNPAAARARLVQFGESALETAIEELRNAKIIRQETKGRDVPGRNFAMTKNFNEGLKSRWKTELLPSAFKYIRLLSEKIVADGHAEFSPHAPQGEVLALLNLKSMGQIDMRLVPPKISNEPPAQHEGAETVSRTLSIWGFTEGNYKTTSINIKNFLFPVHIVPTAIWNTGWPILTEFSKPPAPHLNSGLENGVRKASSAIPVWYDIHGRIMPHIWELVVTAVACTFSLVPGSSAKEAASMCKNAIAEWEIRVLLDWMENVKAAKRTQVGGNRFELTQWWWFILGRQLADGA